MPSDRQRSATRVSFVDCKLDISFENISARLDRNVLKSHADRLIAAICNQFKITACQ